MPPKTGKQNNGSPIYKMILKLVDAGYEGYEFVANDGRMDCLYGSIDKKRVPVRYGGEKVGK